MAGSTFGSHFRITTWGESHGTGIGVVADGCPAGLSLNESDIQFTAMAPAATLPMVSRPEERPPPR